METQSIAIVAATVLAYGLISRRIESAFLTGSILFVLAGILLGPEAFDVLDFEIDGGAVRVLAEATLVLILYTDAIRIDLSRLRMQADLPLRLLGIGLPLSVVAGTAAGFLLLPGFGIWEAALVAAILAPTDAALGQAVVSNPRVPVRVRQALNVESGLNDGFMLPAITVLIAFAAVGEDVETVSYWGSFVAEQIGYAIVGGLTVGYVGGRVLDWCAARDWVEGAYRQLATLAIGVLAFAATEAAGGNGFVAVFIAGLAFGAAARDHCQNAYDFAIDEGELLSLLTFLFFGVALAGPALDQLTPRIAIYVLLSLTLVRLLPVRLAVLGSRLNVRSVLYIGWFGPRGLASILFALFVVEDAELPVADNLLLVVTWTVLASIVLHGVSSVWAANAYGDWYERYTHAHEMPEDIEVEEMRTR